MQDQQVNRKVLDLKTQEVTGTGKHDKLWYNLTVVFVQSETVKYKVSGKKWQFKCRNDQNSRNSILNTGCLYMYTHTPLLN